MVFFRKKQESDVETSDRREKVIAEDHQNKWDELERLVSAQEKIAESEPTPAETPEANKVEFGNYNLLNTDSSEYTSDLQVQLTDKTEFIDVSPSPVNPIPTPPVATPIAAMVASEEFTKDAPIKPTTTGPQPEFTAHPPAVNRPDRADVGAMRLDVARISADIQSGEELYRRAQQRIERLTNFVERAEIDFSMLNRLEPENRRLKARNRTMEREIEATAHKIEVLRVDLEDRENRLQEKTRIYESTLSKLSAAQKSVQEFERALNTSRESSDRNALNAERLQTSLDVERRENEVLRSRLTDTVAEVDAKQTAYIEAKKIADSLAQDCADYRHQSETAVNDANGLRKSLATAQTQNNAMKSEMMGLHEDIRAFKTQSEFTIITREDELSALQQQVDQLTKQLAIKDDIVRNAARDVQELRKIRTAQDLERERLEAQIETQAFQLEQASTELLQTKQDVTDFDRRYRDVATALTVAQTRRMSSEPAETPDIQPREKDELDELTSEDIEERIMDFRLGLREDIT